MFKRRFFFGKENNFFQILSELDHASFGQITSHCYLAPVNGNNLCPSNKQNFHPIFIY